MSLFDAGRIGVKICGITNESDASMCIAAGADALGFNFYAGSKRFIEPTESLPWIRNLAGRVRRVAVVVNADEQLLKCLRDSGCFEFIQFHGDEKPSECLAGGGDAWIRAVRAKDHAALSQGLQYATPDLLLDAWSPLAFGGTGDLADWQMLADFISNQPERNFILAGGLTPANVAEAIQAVGPCGVDVAGGVESSPRKKDLVLVSRFIAAAVGSSPFSRVSS